MRQRINSKLVAAVFVFLLALAAGCAGRDSGSGSRDVGDDGAQGDSAIGQDVVDTATDRAGSDTGGGSSIEGFQTNSDGLNCPPGTDFINLLDDVRLENVVASTGVYHVSGTLDGFFVHDGTSGPHSGILIVFDTGMVSSVSVGDVVTIDGDLLEYYCNTQIRASAVTVTGSANAPAADVVTPADIASNGGPNAEAYEGGLVTVQNVDVTTATPAYGSFEVAGALTVESDIFNFTIPEVGCRYTSITGVIAYSFDLYRLYPRSADDLVLDTSVECEGTTTETTTIAAMQTSALSLACTGEMFEDGGTVSLQGVEIASAPMDVSSTLTGYFVQEGTGGPNSGLLLVFASDPGFTYGDIIDLTGSWTEFFCLTEINVDSFTVVSSATANIEDTLVDIAGSFGATDAVEQWEGVWVSIEGVTIDSVDEHGGALVAGSGLIIDGSYLSGSDATDFAAAFVAEASYSYLQGFIYYSYDKWRLVPTSWNL